MEENRRNQEKGKGYNVGKVEKLRHCKVQRIEENGETTRRIDALIKKLKP